MSACADYVLPSPEALGEGWVRASRRRLTLRFLQPRTSVPRRQAASIRRGENALVAGEPGTPQLLIDLMFHMAVRPERGRAVPMQQMKMVEIHAAWRRGE